VGGLGILFRAAPSAATPGTAITATWSSLFAPDHRDFVGFFEPGTPNTSPLTQRFVTGNVVGGVGLPEGSLELPIPANLVPGRPYEVRFVSGLSGGTMALIALTPPPSADDTYDATSGIALTIPAPGVLANDTTGDPSLPQATVETAPAHGTLALQANGGFTYTASAAFTGGDSFVYRATSQLGVSKTATVRLRVTAAPVGVNDDYTVAENAILNVPAPGVLANDTDADSPSLQATLKTGPAHGTLTLQPSGAFGYKPNEGFSGVDSFVYTATDQTSFSAPVTVAITVTATVQVTDCDPRPPVKVGQAVSAGKLLVHLQGTPLNTQQPNALRSVRFGPLQNAKVTLNGQPVASGQTVTLPVGSGAVDFTVERATPGQATTVPLTAVDGCGAWQTLVGGGPGAGF
jgi:VCBS repeat-containing protein